MTSPEDPLHEQRLVCASPLKISASGSQSASGSASAGHACVHNRCTMSYHLRMFIPRTSAPSLRVRQKRRNCTNGFAPRCSSRRRWANIRCAGCACGGGADFGGPGRIWPGRPELIWSSSARPAREPRHPPQHQHRNNKNGYLTRWHGRAALPGRRGRHVQQRPCPTSPDLHSLHPTSDPSSLSGRVTARAATSNPTANEAIAARAWADRKGKGSDPVLRLRVVWLPCRAR